MGLDRETLGVLLDGLAPPAEPVTRLLLACCPSVRRLAGVPVGAARAVLSDRARAQAFRASVQSEKLATWRGVVRRALDEPLAAWLGDVWAPVAGDDEVVAVVVGTPAARSAEELRLAPHPCALLHGAAALAFQAQRGGAPGGRDLVVARSFRAAALHAAGAAATARRLDVGGPVPDLAGDQVRLHSGMDDVVTTGDPAELDRRGVGWWLDAAG